jgi:hypothetical protein
VAKKTVLIMRSSILDKKIIAHPREIGTLATDPGEALAVRGVFL